ncbi:MAG: hypothetical protein FJ087_11255 [Deltaproteobacteria bacterium]|nr:hypothetical protein [Deltaproteobacteria bacterium]
MVRIPVAALALAALACGAPGLNLKYYQSLNERVERDDFDGARKKLKESKDLYGEKSRLVWHMDHAMIEHLAGDPAASNRQIDAAERTIEELYAKSLTREAVSFLTSDAVLNYQGEDFERVFLNVLGALNYAMLGQPDEAIVEAKRADLKLTERARTHKESPYAEDAFVRYLMGLVYEGGGETNDAWISYARAVATYEKQAKPFGVGVPQGLVRRAAAVAARLSFREELEALRTRYPDLVPADAAAVPPEAGTGRLVVVEMAGMVPAKVENRIELTLAAGLPFLTAQQVESKEESDVSSALTVARSVAGTHNIVIAFPTMKARPPASTPMRVHVDGAIEPGVGSAAAAETVHSLGAIAPKVLEERMGVIWGRTVARAVVKFLLAYAASKAGEAAGGKDYGWLVGFLAGAATSAALGASEHADTRQWGTLPYEVRLVVLDLPPGAHRVSVTSGGWQKDLGEVAVKPGGTAWRVVRTR